MSKNYSLESYVTDLRRITQQTSDEDETLRRVGPLAERLVNERDWLRPEHYGTNEEQGYGVHVLHEEPDHSLAIFVVAWMPGRGSPVHDHGTWAVVVGLDGMERNVRYRRLDDGGRDGFAELEVKSTMTAGPGDLVCMKSGGIHSVHNDQDSVAVSLHTYGKHVNYTVRSQYNLESNEKLDFKVALD